MREAASTIEAKGSSGTGPLSARALWYAAKGVVEIRDEPLPAPGNDQVRVRTRFTGISRGTERLVLNGAVGAEEWHRMRAPLQGGDFPFPVKYGYCATGQVEAGPPDLVGRTVFCLHPHQDHFIAPAAMVQPIPEGVPARRATLAANMETVLNALWDGGAGPADRIVVVGAGVVGLLIGYLAARLPGAEVTIVDVLAERAALAKGLGCRFAKPADVPKDADLAFHTSVTAAGLEAALASLGREGTVVELSWYGNREIPLRLGGAFHSQRLKLVSSQVGQISPGRRPRWDYGRRLAAALRLLADPALDALVSEEIAFERAPTELPALLNSTAGLAPVIRYS